MSFHGVICNLSEPGVEVEVALNFEFLFFFFFESENFVRRNMNGERKDSEFDSFRRFIVIIVLVAGERCDLKA